MILRRPYGRCPYSVIDAIWVSGLGADALAGVGFVSPIFIALMGIGNGLGAGSASALSKYIGEENRQKANNGAIHTIFITVIISVITTVLLLLFLKDILLGMGAGSTIDYAMDYGIILSFGSILVILSNALYGGCKQDNVCYAIFFNSKYDIGSDFHLWLEFRGKRCSYCNIDFSIACKCHFVLLVLH